jgi:hypothetical protein
MYMLSEEGVRDRFWQHYPQLRRVIEGKADSIPRGVNGLLTSDFPDDQWRPSTWQGSIV